MGFRWTGYGERTIKVYGNIQVFDDLEDSLTKNVAFWGKCGKITNDFPRITICEQPTYSECGNDMFIKNQQNILRVES